MKRVLIGLGALLLVGLVLVVVLALMAGGSYNRLVSLQTQTDAAWAQVENVYQRRADLVPNLVATVSGAAEFEQTTLAEVVKARASVGQVKLDASRAPTDAAAMAEFEQAQAGLGGALSRLLVVVEKYPDLKSTSSFRDLQAQLEGTENRISVERGRFNEVVQRYNAAVKSVPAVFYAGLLGFHERPFFAAKAGAEDAPEVKFEFQSHPANE